MVSFVGEAVRSLALESWHNLTGHSRYVANLLSFPAQISVANSFVDYPGVIW
jgi:hypothetical protein